MHHRHVQRIEDAVDGGILGGVERGDVYGLGAFEEARGLLTQEDGPQLCQAVAFGSTHLGQGFFHLLKSGLVEQQIHPDQAHAQPLWQVFGVEYDFHPVFIHKLDDAAAFRMAHGRLARVQADDLASPEVVGLIGGPVALYDDESPLAIGIALLANLQGVPGEAFGPLLLQR